MIRLTSTIPSAVPSVVPSIVPSRVPGAPSAESSALILDTYTGATLAWSFARKLRTAHAGNAFTLRESDGDTEEAIGFSGTDVDSAAAIAHVGSNSGYIPRVYDQSGNSNDGIISTANSQHELILSGTLNTIGEKPATKAQTGTSRFGNLSSLAIAFPCYIFAVVDSTNAGAFADIARTSDNDTRGAFLSFSSVYRPRVHDNAQEATWGSAVQTQYAVMFFFDDSAGNAVQVNDGTKVTDATDLSWPYNWGGGAGGFLGGANDALASELIMYQGSTLTDEQINAVLADMMTYYGIS